MALPQPTRFFKFDNNINDSSPNGINGLFTDGAYVPGKIDEALNLSPTSYMDFDTIDGFPYSNNLSICLWIKLEVTNERSELVVKRDPFISAEIDLAFEYLDTQQLRVRLWRPGLTDTTIPFSPTPNEWYFVGFSYDNLTGILNIAIDGVTSVFSIGTGAVSIQTNIITVGWDRASTYSRAAYDNFYLFATSLTPAQHLELYESQFPTPPPPSTGVRNIWGGTSVGSLQGKCLSVGTPIGTETTCPT